MATADLVQGPPTGQIPSRIGRFTLDQELGRGRMGAVYKATDAQAQRTVAMRIVHAYRFSAEPDVARLQLRNAAKAASGLNSPNIASVIGGGELQELFYLTLEYVPGTTLRQRLLDGEKFSASEFIDVARQLCAGLEHAHSRKIFHGNLVPWNLIFESDGTLKIMDFGLPQSLVASAAREDFAYLPYLSPEVLKGQPLDARADLFSAGCILYEILAGKKAFGGSSREQMAQNILDGFAPPAHESSIMIHPGFSAVLAKALAKDPEDRYQRAADLIRELEAFQGSAAKKAPPQPEAASKSFPTPKPAPASAYGAPSKPLITPKPMEAPAVTAYAAPSKPEFQSMLDKPVAPPSAASTWEPAVVRAKPATPRPQPKPVAAPAPPQEPGKKAAMLLAAASAIVLVAVLIVLWGMHGRNNGAEPVITKDAAPAASQDAQPEAPAAVNPTARTASRQPKPKVVSEAPAVPVAAAPATGELMISANPPGTMVQIDDGAAAPAPIDQTGVSAGTHTIIFSRAGYVTESRKIDVTAGGKALAAITLQPRGAFLSVNAKPAGAIILVDGKESGQTPAKLTVAEGQHSITVRKDGFLPQSATLTFIRGQEAQFSPELMAAGSTSEIKTVGKFKKMFSGGQEMGMVEVKTNPKGATVTVNGQAVPKQTPVTFMLNPGNYEIEVKADGYRSVKRVISLQGGGQMKIEEELKH